MTGPDKRAREYLASIGSKGGKAGGKSKVRGDSDYYKRISAKAAKARAAKRAASSASPATNAGANRVRVQEGEK